MLVSRGQSAGLKTISLPWQQDAAEHPHPYPCHYLSFSMGKNSKQSRMALNEAVFSDPDAQARMAIGLHPISDHGAFDSRELAIDWSIGETHDETY